MAVTVNYTYPATAAATTPPTLAQMASRSLAQGNIQATADADVTAVITHNMNISAADRTLGFPIVELQPILVQFYTKAPIVTITDGNTVTITMASTATGGTANPQILWRVLRPNSLIK